MNWRQERRSGTSGNAALKDQHLARPLARSGDLIVEEAADELLVYDERIHRAHCLSATAARVWRRCDGRTSFAVLCDELALDADTARRALDELESCALLESAAEPAGGSTRRELAVRAAKVGAIAAAAPLIVSVTAPTPAQAAATVKFCASACPAAGCADSGSCGGCCTSAFAGCGCCVHTANNVKHCTPAGATAATKSDICKSLYPGSHISCTG